MFYRDSEVGDGSPTKFTTANFIVNHQIGHHQVPQVKMKLGFFENVKAPSCGPGDDEDKGDGELRPNKRLPGLSPVAVHLTILRMKHRGNAWQRQCCRERCRSSSLGIRTALNR